MRGCGTHQIAICDLLFAILPALTPHLIGVLAALGSAASWAVGTLLFKGIGEEFSPMAMTFIKSFLGLLLLAGALFLAGWEPVKYFPLGWLSLSGLLGISLGDTFFFAALRRLPAHQLIILMLLAPVVTLLMAFCFLGERPGIVCWVGIILVLSGVTLTFKGKIEADQDAEQRGQGLFFGVLSVLSMAGSVIIAKIGLQDISAMEGTFLRLFFGFGGMLVVGLARREVKSWLVPLRQAGLGWRFLLAVFVVTFGGFWLSLDAIKRLDVSVANTLLATEPVFALPLAVIWLREHATGAAVIGTIVALCGAGILAFNG
jgi:drug/metabolite transporter (DMT)-like permease